MNSGSAFMWAILAAICWGFAPLVEKAGLSGRVDPVLGVFVRSIGVLIGALGFLPFLSKLSPHFSSMSLKHWLFLILGGILASIVGQLCFYRALKIGEVSRVVPIGAAYPVIACVLGIFLFKEPVSFSKACGIALVMAGVYLLR